MASEIDVIAGAIDEIWKVGEQMQLDPFPIHFEVVPANIMYEVGSYGLPGRFSHWTHGKSFHQMKTMYDYGLSKIYELIINSNPAQAFLMEGNSLIQNKLVIAHVIGHSDFFKNNAYFQHTSRQMAETASVNAERIRAYEFDHGEEAVEQFLDAILSVQEHIDPNLRVRRPGDEELEQARRHPTRRTTEYDDLWNLREEEVEQGWPRRRIPEEPEKDLLLFLLQWAPELEDWQRDIISIVRNEMMYFLPQMQTKIMNEGWACATGESLLATERGFLRFRDLYDRRERLAVGSGALGAVHPVTGYHTEARVPTLRITTRRGYTIEGALKHRIRLADGSWAFLRDLKAGDRVSLAVGTEVWARDPARIDWHPMDADATLHDVADLAGTSLSTVLRHRAGRGTQSAAAIDAALCDTSYRAGRPGKVLSTRQLPEPPPELDQSLAHLLGAFVGDGSWTKSGFCITCGDGDYARRLADLAQTTLGVPATLRSDPSETGPRWRIDVHSREVIRLLTDLGLDPAVRAAAKTVPDAILQSPREAIAAFLSGYFDADAYAGPEGVTLSSASRDLVETVQIILLNFGILSTQRRQTDGCHHLEVRGTSAARFRDAIGFRLERKQAALDRYVADRCWFKQEAATDEIVAITPGEADVFDITVDEAHAYVANGLLHHNSFWHARILRDMDITAEEHLEFTRLHASVLSPSPRGTSINPYYLGFKIFEDIERRWNGDLSEDERKDYHEQNRRDWPHQGQGREKIYEIRETENDVSFIRNYLTRQLIDDLDMYIYRREGDEWVIVEKDWRKVRDTLVESMTNFGYPYIVVEDGDYRRNRELYLVHRTDTRELDLNYAHRTLRHLHTIWGRPVHLETVMDEKRVVLSFDGETDEVRALE